LNGVFRIAASGKARGGKFVRFLPNPMALFVVITGSESVSLEATMRGTTMRKFVFTTAVALVLATSAYAQHHGGGGGGGGMGGGGGGMGGGGGGGGMSAHVSGGGGPGGAPSMSRGPSGPSNMSRGPSGRSNFAQGPQGRTLYNQERGAATFTTIGAMLIAASSTVTTGLDAMLIATTVRISDIAASSAATSPNMDAIFASAVSLTANGCS
jgi:hypothetical protein